MKETGEKEKFNFEVDLKAPDFPIILTSRILMHEGPYHPLFKEKNFRNPYTKFIYYSVHFMRWMSILSLVLFQYVY